MKNSKVDPNNQTQTSLISLMALIEPGRSFRENDHGPPHSGRVMSINLNGRERRDGQDLRTPYLGGKDRCLYLRLSSGASGVLQNKAVYPQLNEVVRYC